MMLCQYVQGRERSYQRGSFKMMNSKTIDPKTPQKIFEHYPRAVIGLYGSASNVLAIVLS